MSIQDLAKKYVPDWDTTWWKRFALDQDLADLVWFASFATEHAILDEKRGGVGLPTNTSTMEMVCEEAGFRTMRALILVQGLVDYSPMERLNVTGYCRRVVQDEHYAASQQPPPVIYTRSGGKKH